jgi:hypothetical protein
LFVCGFAGGRHRAWIVEVWGGKRREDERGCGGVIGVAHKVVWEKGEVITDTGYLFMLIAGLE